MNDRDVLCSSQRVLDLVSGQHVWNHLPPEPCILLRSSTNFPRSYINQALPPYGSVNSFDLHHWPENVGRPTFYEMTEYSQPNHPIANNPSYFNVHLDHASRARMFPVPLKHGFVDQLPSSSNYRGNVVPFNEHGRRDYSSESVRDICKKKSIEGIPGNLQHFGASARPSSSSIVPMTNCHFDSKLAYTEAPLPLPYCRNNGTPPMMEVGAQYKYDAVGLHMDSGMMHNFNNLLLQVNYGDQSFQSSSCTWLDLQSISNARGLPWSGPPMMPYFQGRNIHGGSSELANVGLPEYPERSYNHGSISFLHSPPIAPQHHNLLPSHNIQGVRGYSVACYPPFLAAPIPQNDGMQHDALSISPENQESVNQPTGIRIYWSHVRSLVPDVASRRRDVHLRTLPSEDNVALLEFPNYYEVDYNAENYIDHHSDMRLDIDHMSYEDLLALSEHIGTVSTGLTEEDITCHLKIKQYSSTKATINLEELPCMDQDYDSCIICQDEYEDNDKLGTLECGHEYHVDCLKKWLLLKNVCPICKSLALAIKDK